MTRIGYGIMAIGVGATLLFGYKGCTNFNNRMHGDKYITTEINMAASTATLNKDQGPVSMELCLENAESNAKMYSGNNQAILLKSKDYFGGDNLCSLIATAKKEARELGMLDQAYKTGVIPKDAPEWVRLTYQNNMPSKLLMSDNLVKRLADNEFLSVIRDAYEGLNDAVSGGVVVSGKYASNSNNASLIDILHEAKSNSWLPWTDVKFKDMQNAYAHTYFALIYSNMAQLDKAIGELGKAKDFLKGYKDDALTSFAARYEYLTVGFMRKSLESAIKELSDLNDMDSSKKYTSGWFGQIQKKSESLGAEDVYIGALAQDLVGKDAERSIYDWLLAVASLGTIGLGKVIRDD